MREFSLPSRRSGARIGRRETGAGSVVFGVLRKDPCEENRNGIKRKIREMIERQGCAWIESEALPDDDTYCWLDWYRLPIPSGRNVQWAVSMLVATGVSESLIGWGVGKDSPFAFGNGVGDGAKIIRHKVNAERKAVLRAQERAEPFVRLVSRLEGLKRHNVRLHEIPYDPAGLAFCPDWWEQAGFKCDAFFTLAERFPGFPHVLKTVIEAFDSAFAGGKIPDLDAYSAAVAGMGELRRWLIEDMKLPDPEEEKAKKDRGEKRPAGRYKVGDGPTHWFKEEQQGK